MAKSIKLKNNVYWDPSSILYGVSRKTFSIAQNQTKTLNFSGRNLVFLLAGKTTLSGGIELWSVATYQSGLAGRTRVERLVNYNNDLSFSTDEKKLIITNNSQTYDCSVVILLGNPTDITIN